MEEEAKIVASCRDLFSQEMRAPQRPSSSQTASDFFSPLPPFETFAYDLSSERIEIQFEDEVRVGDVLLVKVGPIDSVGARVYPLCFAERIRRDLSLTKLDYLVSVSSLERRINSGETHRARVICVKPFQLTLEAGAVSKAELPEYFRESFEMKSKPTFDEYLTENARILRDPFLPTTVAMPERSAVSCLNGEVKETDFEKTAIMMRKAQDKAEVCKIIAEAVAKMKDKEFNAAITMLNDALKICPEFADCLVTRGAAFYHKKMYELAVKDLERAVEMEPSHPNGINYLTTALIHWANEFMYKEDYEQAKAKYSRALEVKPEDREALKGLEQIWQKENEVLVVKEVSAEERRREEKKRKRKEEEEAHKKRAKLRENREKLAEMESFIAALKKK